VGVHVDEAGRATLPPASIVLRASAVIPTPTCGRRECPNRPPPAPRPSRPPRSRSRSQIERLTPPSQPSVLEYPLTVKPERHDFDTAASCESPPCRPHNRNGINGLNWPYRSPRHRGDLIGVSIFWRNSRVATTRSRG
jgi:hypothetical protein